MGEKANEMQLFANVCGEWKPLSRIDATPILEAASSPTEIFHDQFLSPITIRCRLPKYFRCRSRKRLIKLLMANKLDRAEAERIAWQVCASRMSYQDAWSQIWPHLIYL